MFFPIKSPPANHVQVISFSVTHVRKMACCSGGDKEKIAEPLGMGELGEKPAPEADNADTEDTAETSDSLGLGASLAEVAEKAEAEALAALPWYARAYARCC